MRMGAPAQAVKRGLTGRRRAAQDPGVTTSERFAQGLTFDACVQFVGTPENLAREAGWRLGPRRQDFGGLLRQWRGRTRPSEPERLPGPLPLNPTPHRLTQGGNARAR